MCFITLFFRKISAILRNTKLAFSDNELNLNPIQLLMRIQTTTMRKLIALLLWLFPVCTFAQREQVNLKVRNAAAMRKFEYHQHSFYEVVNGKFSASLASSNGYVFEITGISNKQLKCDNFLTPSQFKVVLIDNRLNKTYTSNSKSKGILNIKCLPNGGYELIYQGEIYSEGKRVNVSANLSGEIAHSKNLKTN